MREPQNTSISVSRFQRGAGVFDHIGGTGSHGGAMDYPRFLFSEMHLGKFPDSMKLQSWKINFKVEVCWKTADPHLTIQWIKEVEIAKSIGIIAIDCGGNRFSRLRYAWCDDCICIEKASRQASALPKKSKCRRAACSEIRPILTMEADFFCDLRAFSNNQSLWSSTGFVRSVQY